MSARPFMDHTLVMAKGFAYRATQDGQIIVESSDKMWSTRGGNGKLLQYSCLEHPMNSMKRQKGTTPADERPRSESVQ